MLASPETTGRTTIVGEKLAVIVGYAVKDRKLVINETEAATVRMIFDRFVAIGSATTLAKALVAEGVRNKRGKPIDKGFLYKLLNNRVYLGEAVHKGTAYAGEHAAIVGRDLWDKVHSILGESPRQRAANTRTQEPALLKGVIFTETGAAMTPTATKKGSRLYRYYTSMDLIRNRATDEAKGPLRLAASEFRRRHLKALASLFVQVLKLAEKAGLVKLGHVALDGAKIKANASKHKAMTYERMKKRESELAAEVERWLKAAAFRRNDAGKRPKSSARRRA